MVFLCVLFIMFLYGAGRLIMLLVCIIADPDSIPRAYKKAFVPYSQYPDPNTIPIDKRFGIKVWKEFNADQLTKIENYAKGYPAYDQTQKMWGRIQKKGSNIYWYPEWDERDKKHHNNIHSRDLGLEMEERKFEYMKQNYHNPNVTICPIVHNRIDNVFGSTTCRDLKTGDVYTVAVINERLLEDIDDARLNVFDQWNTWVGENKGGKWNRYQYNKSPELKVYMRIDNWELVRPVDEIMWNATAMGKRNYQTIIDVVNDKITAIRTRNDSDEVDNLRDILCRPRYNKTDYGCPLCDYICGFEHWARSESDNDLSKYYDVNFWVNIDMTTNKMTKEYDRLNKTYNKKYKMEI